MKKHNNSDFDQYTECLKTAKKRNEKGTLKLCPEGYCTAKHKFEVYPSAYANGYASQVCSGSKPDINGNMANHYSKPKEKDSNLSRWFEERWVNVCQKDENSNYKPCGRSQAKLDRHDYPYCRPLKKLPGTTVKSVSELTQDQLGEMCRKKRSIQPGVNRSPTRVYVKDLHQERNRRR